MYIYSVRMIICSIIDACFLPRAFGHSVAIWTPAPRISHYENNDTHSLHLKFSWGRVPIFPKQSVSFLSFVSNLPLPVNPFSSIHLLELCWFFLHLLAKNQHQPISGLRDLTSRQETESGLTHLPMGRGGKRLNAFAPSNRVVLINRLKLIFC